MAKSGHEHVILAIINLLMFYEMGLQYLYFAEFCPETSLVSLDVFVYLPVFLFAYLHIVNRNNKQTKNKVTA